MTTSNSSTMQMSGDNGFDFNSRQNGKNKSCGKGKWTTFNIAAMVLGFVFCWPIGLFVLFWIMSGRDVKQIPSALQEQWNRLFSGSNRSSGDKSDNSVFNDYQQTQYDRISEIKEEIKDRASRFSEYRSDAKRRADEKEFRTFMESRDKRDDDDK
ncbi:MAG: DUF2852 domain-containing protein [Alphaproteobacteria bacterium]